MKHYLSGFTSIAQVQVVASVLGAHQLEPGRRFRKEFHTSHHAGSWTLGRATGDLRGQGKEDFIHQPSRHEVPEKSRAPFMQHDSHAVFIMQMRKDRRWVDQAAGIVERNHFRGIKCAHASPRQFLLAGFRGDDQNSGAGRVEDGSPQVQFAASADNHEQRVPRLLENSLPVVGIGVFGLGVDGFRDPKMVRAYLANGSRSDDDSIYRGSEQSHDETVGFVRTADGAPARMTQGPQS